ncbi:transposon, En/Spm-like protein [Tanacetum coccineum]
MHEATIFYSFSDNSREKRFKLRASLLWTVNDFPAYANLSGWSTKVRVVCPTYANSTRSMWLKHGKKFCYTGHRRWLEENHPYRFQKDRFDGTIEVDGPPTIMLGSDILKQLRGSSFKYGKLTKLNNKRRRDDVGCSTSSPLPVTNDESSAFDDIKSFIEEDIDGDNQLWKKRSIFLICHIGSSILLDIT